MADKILILSIDRDDDLGRKTGIKGPVIGEKKVKEAANAFGVVDPEDSDFNAMFDALRAYNEVKKDHTTEVVILTGDKEVGIKSDKNISDQLATVLKKFPATGAVLVSDGAEDEQILPIIQSRVPIISVRKVIVKQADQLQSSYFKVKDFITESLDDPKMARMVFGLPALILLLLGVFGFDGLRIVVGILGIYLIIKGFKLESAVFTGINELKTTFTKKRMSFFLYMIGIVLGVLASYRGYTYAEQWFSIGIFETIAGFLNVSAYIFWIAISIIWFGMLTTHKHRHTTGVLASGPIFGFALALVISNATTMVLQPSTGLTNFIISIIFGFVLIALALYLEKRK